MPRVVRWAVYRVESSSGSVARHSGVDGQGPRLDASVEILDARESVPCEQRAGRSAAPAVVAMDHDASLPPVRDLGDAPFEFGERDQAEAFDAAVRELARIPHVEQQQRLAPLPARRQLGRTHGDHAVRLGRSRAGAGAVARRIAQFAQARLLAADRAGGILRERELAELHVQRVVEQQPSDQRRAEARQQLDRLGGLDHRDEARQHTEHASLGAGSHVAGGGGSGKRQR